MWKKGTTTLFLQDKKIQVDNRLQRFRNKTLAIPDVKIEDSGNYTCQVVAEKVIEVTHFLQVVSE